MSALEHLPVEVARRRVLATKAAAEFCSLGLGTFRRMHTLKQLPDAIRLSERRLGWRIGDLMDWLDARAAGLEWAQYLAGRAGNDNAKLGIIAGGGRL